MIMVLNGTPFINHGRLKNNEWRELFLKEGCLVCQPF